MVMRGFAVDYRHLMMYFDRMRRSWIILVLVLAVVRCTNPFSVRSPEPPTTGQNIGFNLQANPDSLLSKIALAFVNSNAESYIECFAEDGFSYLASPNEANRFGDWDLLSEKRYFEQLVLGVEDVTFSRTAEPSRLLETPSSAELSFRYSIAVKSTSKTERYQGESLLRIDQAGSGFWHITSWQDFSAEGSDSTWSTLRANYR